MVSILLRFGHDRMWLMNAWFSRIKILRMPSKNFLSKSSLGQLRFHPSALWLWMELEAELFGNSELRDHSHSSDIIWDVNRVESTRQEAVKTPRCLRVSTRTNIPLAHQLSSSPSSPQNQVRLGGVLPDMNKTALYILVQ